MMLEGTMHLFMDFCFDLEFVTMRLARIYTPHPQSQGNHALLGGCRRFLGCG